MIILLLTIITRSVELISGKLCFMAGKSKSKKRRVVQRAVLVLHLVVNTTP